MYQAYVNSPLTQLMCIRLIPITYFTVTVKFLESFTKEIEETNQPAAFSLSLLHCLVWSTQPWLCKV